MTSISRPTETDRPGSPTRFGAWWTVAVLLLCYVVAWVDRHTMVVTAEVIGHELHLTDVQLGVLLGPTFAVMYAASGLLLGIAADRFDRRLVIFLGMLAWSIGTAASGIAESFPGLAAARMLIAVGEAALVPAAYSLIADRFATGRLTTAIAVFTTGPKAGMALAFLIAALTIQHASFVQHLIPGLQALAPWRINFILVGGAGAICSLLLFSFREPRRAADAPVRDSQPRFALLRYLASHRRLALLFVTAAIPVSMGVGAIHAWVPTFMTRQFGWTAADYGAPLTFILLASVGMVICKGVIVDWLYSKGVRDAHLRFYAWLLTASVPIGALAFFVDSPWIFLLLYGFIDAIAVPFMAYFSATIQLVSPKELRGQISALFFGIIAILGNGFGPVAVGVLTDKAFGAPGSLGLSLMIVLTTSIVASLLAVRAVLPSIRAAAEERAAS